MLESLSIDVSLQSLRECRGPSIGDNLDVIEAILAVNGRSGRVVEGLAGRVNLISRGGSRRATSTALIVSLLLR